MIKKNQTGFVPVIIILVVLIGFVGVYYLGRLNPKKEVSNPTSSPVATVIDTSKPTIPTTKPTTDPTVNWKTYTNKKIGASIKYPQNWVLKEESNGISVDFNTTTLSPKIVDQNQVNYYFNFQLEDPANFQAWSNDVSSKKLSPLKINGMTFERIIGADMFYSLNYIYKTLDGKIYRFYLGPYTEFESSTVLDDTVSQILSTFKFTN